MAVLQSLPPLQRIALADPPASRSDIQFNIGAFLDPVVTRNGILFQFGPVFTRFTTFQLSRTPTLADQNMLISALNKIENHFDFSPKGLFVQIAYGLPYFNRLPQTLVQHKMPQVLNTTPSVPVLQEAVQGPTDVHPNNPTITKRQFNVQVQIENNDVLITFRSDSQANITNALAWLRGSNILNSSAVPSPAGFNELFTLTSSRLMFVREGLPRQIAEANPASFQQPSGQSFINMLNPNAPMFMGFHDQHVNGSGPAEICTFLGNSSAHHTDATAGSYFDNGAIQHLSHVILDLPQFYDQFAELNEEPETFLERVQYMFRSNPPPNLGNRDQFTNGGGPAAIPNTFQGTDDALHAAQGIGTPNGQHRIGHLSALQRSSRAPDGTPMHMRIDGPGFDKLDVPGGADTAKLQFSIFVPSAFFFSEMRKKQAALGLQETFEVDESENGLERFLTATRRQNFLIPPVRHRAFPLLELA